MSHKEARDSRYRGPAAELELPPLTTLRPASRDIQARSPRPFTSLAGARTVDLFKKKFG